MSLEDTPPRAVVFDCFGVLYADRFRERLAGLSPQDQAQCWALDRANSMGQLSDHDFYARLAPIMLASGRELRADFHDTDQLIPGMPELIEEVRRAGAATHLLTNVDSRLFLDPFLRRTYRPGHRVHELFDVIMASCDVQVMKPDTPIYAKMAARIGVEMRDWLYVDDSPRNLRAPHRHGARTYLFAPPYDISLRGLRRALMRYQVLPNGQ